jgi:hypothetical protein
LSKLTWNDILTKRLDGLCPDEVVLCKKEPKSNGGIDVITMGKGIKITEMLRYVYSYILLSPSINFSRSTLAQPNQKNVFDFKVWILISNERDRNALSSDQDERTTLPEFKPRSSQPKIKKVQCILLDYENNNQLTLDQKKTVKKEKSLSIKAEVKSPIKQEYLQPKVPIKSEVPDNDESTEDEDITSIISPIQIRQDSKKKPVSGHKRAASSQITGNLDSGYGLRARRDV